MSLRLALSSTLAVAFVLDIELVEHQLVVSGAHIALAAGIESINPLSATLHAFLGYWGVPVL